MRSEKSREQQNAWQREYARRWRATDGGARHRASVKSYREALKLEIVVAYGGECSCCGEERIEFLTIDHKTPVGGGIKNGIKVRMTNAVPASSSCGYRLYRWLRDKGFPKGDFRLLCYNCNSGRRRGPCPHEIERSRAALKVVFE